MKIVDKIKSVMPVSSRSFHAYEKRSEEKLDELTEYVREMSEAIVETRNHTTSIAQSVPMGTDAIGNGLRILDERVSAAFQHQTDWLYDEMERHAHDCAVRDAHARIFLEGIYKHDGETENEMNKRLFASLSPSKGRLRLSQEATAKMMAVIDELCSYLGIGYWLGYGTLLGSKYCKGPIPWDDDMDICMLRDDIGTLSDFLKKAHDEGYVAKDSEEDKMLSLARGYQVTTVYDEIVLCSQKRFSSADSNLPCFVDLSVYDRAKDISDEAAAAYKGLREEMMEELRAMENGGVLSYWKEHPYIPAKSNVSVVAQCVPVDWDTLDANECKVCENVIEDVLRKYRDKADKMGILCDSTTGTEEFAGYAFALDNLTDDAPNRKMLWDKNIIDPRERAPYMGYSFLVPSNAEAVLEQTFNDPPYLPDDILGHEHYDRGETKAESVLAAMKRYVGGK